MTNNRSRFDLPKELRFISEAQNREHEAWQEMFECMRRELEMTKEELNMMKFRPIFAQIERWAWFNHLRIEELKKSGNFKPEWEGRGIFWDGD